MCDGDRVALVDDGCAGPYEAVITAVSACRESTERLRIVTSPATAPATSRKAAALQSLSISNSGRPVALSSGHVEFFIVFMQDFDAEALGRVDRDVDIGGRVLRGERESSSPLRRSAGPAAVL